jgi:glycosyltransferase involved in cell wall biosynthesis
VRNLRESVDRAIRSVTTSSASVELLVLDAGSTDGTLEIIRHHADRIAYRRSRPDRGPPEAINEGVQHARGVVIGLLAADDWYETGGLEAVEHEFRTDPELQVLSTGVRIALATHDGVIDKKIFTSPTDLQFSAANLVRHPLSHGRFIRKSLYERLGGYVETYRVSNDLDFLLRLCFLRPKSKVLSRVCYTYVGHPDSRTISGRPEAVLVTSIDNAALAESFLAKSGLSRADRRALVELHGRSSARLAWNAMQRGDWGKSAKLVGGALVQNPLWPASVIYWLTKGLGKRIHT